MKKLMVAILLAAGAAAGTFEAVAMPTRAELKKVSGTVNELMSDDMKGVKSGKLKRKEAADHAVGYAREATDEASKFLFYKGAFGLYVRDRAFDDAMRAIDLLRKEVKDIPDKVLLEIVGGKMKDIPRENGGALVALYESLDRKIRHQGDLERLQSAVKKNPKDDDARHQLALCRARLGDWPAALKDFSLLTGAEAKAAKSESIGELKQAADGWWALGANAYEDEQALFRSHAADLYRRALAKGKLSGIQKSLAQKRADEYPAEAVGAAKPAPTERGGQDAAKPVAVATKAVVKPGKGIMLTLKKGVPLEFVHCPAGTYTKGICYTAPAGNVMRDRTHKVTISRPFYMTRTPVTIRQWVSDRWNMKWEDVPEARMHPRQRLLAKFPEFGVKDGTAAQLVGPRGCFGSGNIINECDLPDIEKWMVELTRRHARELPRGYVVRFPTEAEFEYAVRAGSDDVNDLFVNPDLSPEQQALLATPKENWFRLYEGSEELRSERALLHLIQYGGFPSPVAKGRANAWGISDGWGYVHLVVLADMWSVGKPQGQYNWAFGAPRPEAKGAETDPVLMAAEGKAVGHVLYCTPANGSWRRKEYMRGVSGVALRMSPTGAWLPGVRDITGFFLVIAPDVKTLTPITPPKE